MSRLLIYATVRGSGTNGVIHTGFRRWIVQQAIALNCDCIATNEGSTVKLIVSGSSSEARIVIAKARIGPPDSRVLSVTIDREEHVNAVE